MDRYTIRFLALIDPDDSFSGRGIDIPLEMRDRMPRGTRIAIFELGGYGLRNYIGIPAQPQDEDAMIRAGRAALHKMLSGLSQESEKWKPTPEASGGTP
jgi:hypothetical protein